MSNSACSSCGLGGFRPFRFSIAECADVLQDPKLCTNALNRLWEELQKEGLYVVWSHDIGLFEVDLEVAFDSGTADLPGLFLLISVTNRLLKFSMLVKVFLKWPGS